MPLASHAQLPGADAVRIECTVKSEQERKDLKNTQADQVTQNKTITITLTGKPKSPETRTATWVAYGKDEKTHALQPLDQGEFKVDLSAGVQKIDTKRISTTFTPEHVVNKGDTRLKNPRWQHTDKVAAEGKKFTGYVVTVKDGEKVVGKFADPMGLDSQVAQAGKSY